MTAQAGAGVAERLQLVRQEIERVASAAGRDSADVKLIAVSKSFPASVAGAALAAGQTELGENRVQELLEKAAGVGPSPRWHFVGRLQRNKVRKLLAVRPTIHSVDRVGLARYIDSVAEAPVPVLLEVNVSGERQKGGVEPQELPELVGAVLSMPHVDLIGLMTMAPRSADPEAARPVFRELARLRREMAEAYSCPRIHHLSMGMSQDYRVAVEEGATMVRLGEAVFGPRTSPQPSEGIDPLGNQKG